MKIHYRHPLFKYWPLKHYAAIVIGRHCLTKYAPTEMPEYVIRHELIHQKQMDRHGIVGFYLIYVKDYIKNLVKYKNHRMAYLAIPFEVEAYRNQ